MIGNDIVDIAEAARKSNWQRKGYLKKVFTNNEQLYILNSDNPDLSVWLLWSLKESAYKIYRRQQLKYFFSPLKAECKLITPYNKIYRGEVCIENFRYITASSVTKDFISTTAVIKDEPVNAEIIKKDIKFLSAKVEKQSEEIYSAVIKKFSDKIKKPSENMSIKKDAYGIPYIYEGKYKYDIVISISHHGRYGAYLLYF